MIVEDKAAWEPLVERLVDFILDPHGAGKPITRATPEQQLKQIASRLRLLSEHRHAAR